MNTSGICAELMLEVVTWVAWYHQHPIPGRRRDSCTIIGQNLARWLARLRDCQLSASPRIDPERDPRVPELASARKSRVRTHGKL